MAKKKPSGWPLALHLRSGITEVINYIKFGELADAIDLAEELQHEMARLIEEMIEELYGKPSETRDTGSRKSRIKSKDAR